MSSAPLLGPAPILSPRLRDAGEDDLDAVMAVMAHAFDPAFGEGWNRAQCAGILPMTGVRMRLAGDGDGPLAFSLARAVADEAELLLIAVDPQAQNRGLGHALLDDFAAWAGARGARRIHLEVRDGNPAILLYRRHGYRVVGRRRGYYKGPGGTRHDALTMARGE